MRREGEGGLAICLTDIYLDAAHARVVPRVGRQPVAVYRLLEEEYGVRVFEIEQSISAVALEEAEAEALCTAWP